MLADVAISTKVPAEFIGLARVFRAEVKMVDAVVEEALDLICAPLQARLARHPKLRHEQVAGTGRQYDQLIPSQFRIGPVSAMRHRTKLELGAALLAILFYALLIFGGAQAILTLFG